MEAFAAFEDSPAVADDLPETVPNTQYYVDEEEVTYDFPLHLILTFLWQLTETPHCMCEQCCLHSRSRPGQGVPLIVCIPLQALGFHIWVAELELLVGQARGSRQGVDPVAAMELLQKLQVTIESSDKARIREYQRRCEDALECILLKGTAPPVRTTPWTSDLHCPACKS